MVCKSNNCRVYGRCIQLVSMVYKATNITWGGHHWNWEDLRSKIRSLSFHTGRLRTGPVKLNYDDPFRKWRDSKPQSSEISRVWGDTDIICMSIGSSYVLFSTVEMGSSSQFTVFFFWVGLKAQTSVFWFRGLLQTSFCGENNVIYDHLTTVFTRLPALVFGFWDVVKLLCFNYVEFSPSWSTVPHMKRLMLSWSSQSEVILYGK